MAWHSDSKYHDLDSARAYHPKYFAKKFGLTVTEAEVILRRATSRKDSSRLANESRLEANSLIYTR
jgi:hypothetical protein